MAGTLRAKHCSASYFLAAVAASGIASANSRVEGATYAFRDSGSCRTAVVTQLECRTAAEQLGLPSQAATELSSSLFTSSCSWDASAAALFFNTAHDGQTCSGQTRCLCRVSAQVSEQEDAEDAEQEMPLTSQGTAVAATLIGAICFMMGIFCMTHHPDNDMRRYTYEVISATISIFAAVLLFQNCNRIIDEILKRFGYSAEAGDQNMIIVFNFVQTLVWSVTLEITLGVISGAVGNFHPEEERNRVSEAGKAKVEIGMKCYAVILAHLTGFASINAWGSVQQLDYFQRNSNVAFLAVLVALAGQVVIQSVFGLIRGLIIKVDKGWDAELKRKWEEETQEAETDINALTVSFLTTQAVRFAICKHLPNVEGQEPWHILVHAPEAWAPMLLVVGHLFLYLMMAIIFLWDTIKEEQAEPAERPEVPPGQERLLQAEHNAVTMGSQCRDHPDDASPDGSLPKCQDRRLSSESRRSVRTSRRSSLLEAGSFRDQMPRPQIQPARTPAEDLRTEETPQLAERIVENILLILSMCFAWCMFFGVRQLLCTCRVLSSRNDMMVIAACVAIAATGISFLAMYLLDKIADMDCTGEKVDDAIRRTIGSFGILVGFSWEQSFDQAVQAISMVSPYPQTSRTILSVFCLLVVVPAWRWWILPLVHLRGWEIGVVPDRTLVATILRHEAFEAIFKDLERQGNSAIDRQSIQQAQKLLLTALMGECEHEENEAGSARVRAEAERERTMFSVALQQVGDDDEDDGATDGKGLIAVSQQESKEDRPDEAGSKGDRPAEAVSRGDLGSGGDRLDKLRPAGHSSQQSRPDPSCKSDCCHSLDWEELEELRRRREQREEATYLSPLHSRSNPGSGGSYRSPLPPHPAAPAAFRDQGFLLPDAALGRSDLQRGRPADISPYSRYGGARQWEQAIGPRSYQFP